MSNLVHLRGDPHEETQKLLPWYVTATLDSTDRMVVEAHLRDCEECRIELAAEQRLARAVSELPAPGESGWDRFATALEERPSRRRWLPRPGHVAWFVAAQAAVIVLVIGIVAQRPQNPRLIMRWVMRPRRRTGNILAMFKPDTSEQDLRRALEASGARLVDGPTAAGAYMLAVAPEQRPTALAILRKQPGVTLAEPIDTAP